jgi:hypothetical protein
VQIQAETRGRRLANPRSLSRQCQLLALSHAALYYRPVEVSACERELVALIDRSVALTSLLSHD